MQKDGILPLLTLLLDTSTQWDVPQEQALALARHLASGTQYTPLICCPKSSPLARSARDAGIPHRHLAPSANPWNLLQLWFFQRHHRSLLLHSFSPQALNISARLPEWRKPGSTALLHSCFDSGNGANLPPRKEGKITDRAWLAADKILCPHTVLRAELAKAGLGTGRLHVVHPACDVDALPPREPRLPDAAQRFVFMALEDLREGSGIFVLLRAMAALWQRDDLPPWEVRVTGEGPAFDALLEEAHSLGVASRLALLSRQKLADVLPHCDALLAPSRQPEGHMAALMAAWCSQLPLVCSAVPGHLELAKAGQTALTVPPGDAQALAAAMIRLMHESQTCHHLVEQGKALRDHASYARMGQQCQNIYADCVARQGWVLPPHTVKNTEAAEPAPDSTDQQTKDIHEV